MGGREGEGGGGSMGGAGWVRRWMGSAVMAQTDLEARAKVIISPSLVHLFSMTSCECAAIQSPTIAEAMLLRHRPSDAKSINQARMIFKQPRRLDVWDVHQWVNEHTEL